MASSADDEMVPRSMRNSVSVRRLAAFLDVNQKAIWSLIERRKIRAIRVGKRSVRILPAEVKRFIASIAYVPGPRQNVEKPPIFDTTCSVPLEAPAEATEGAHDADRC